MTRERRDRFLALLAEGYTVAPAAERAGISRQALYQRRAADPTFAAEWDAAIEAGKAARDGAARRRRDGIY